MFAEALAALAITGAQRDAPGCADAQQHRDERRDDQRSLVAVRTLRWGPDVT